MPRRAVDCLARVIGGKARYIVHLQADRMAESVRKEHGGYPRFDGALGTHADKAVLLKHFGKLKVGVDMQGGVILARTDLFTKIPLHPIHRFNQDLEFRGIVRRIGARDVAGVAMEAGPGVDQERVRMRRRRVAQVVIMQYRAVFIERDDVRVGQLVFGLLRRIEIGHVDAEFRFPCAEGLFGGTMRTRADFAGNSAKASLASRTTTMSKCSTQ